MARHRFAGVADYVISVGTDNAATLQPGATVTCWNDPAAGSQYTDLTEVDGVTPITDGELTADATGAVPEFFGPDAVRELYLDANGGSGPRRRTVSTTVGSELATVETDLSTHLAEVNPHGAGLEDLVDTAVAPATVDVKGGGRLTYDGVQALWRPDGASGALMGWHAALAGRHFARANVVCIGDSITEGQGATDWGNTWPARLRQLLRARFPTAGVTGGGGWVGAQSTGEDTYTWPATISGGPTANDNWGPSRRVVQLDASAPADKITYGSLEGTAADIMWVRHALGGNFQYRVDGGAWTTVMTGGDQQDGMLTRVTLGASGSGPHTLEIEASSGGFQAWVSGVVEYDGDEDAGISVHNCGHHGFDTSFWLTTSFPTSWPAAVAALDPGLVIVMLGANDHFLGTDPATFRTNLSTLLTTLRTVTPALTPYPPILLGMHAARDGAFAFTWPEYVEAAHDAVVADGNACVLDLTLGPRLPNYADSPNWGLYADTAHWSDTGNAYAADRIADFISPK